MKAIVTDGPEQVFEGDDARAVVREMRDAEWQAPDKKREYMAEVADRVEQMTGEPVDLSSADTFLLSLETIGLIELED